MAATPHTFRRRAIAGTLSAAAIAHELVDVVDVLAAATGART